MLPRQGLQRCVGGQGGKTTTRPVGIDLRERLSAEIDCRANRLRRTGRNQNRGGDCFQISHSQVCLHLTNGPQVVRWWALPIRVRGPEVWFAKPLPTTSEHHNSSVAKEIARGATRSGFKAGLLYDQRHEMRSRRASSKFDIATRSFSARHIIRAVLIFIPFPTGEDIGMYGINPELGNRERQSDAAVK